MGRYPRTLNKLYLIFLVASGCGRMNVSILDLGSSKDPDFLKTEIISNGPGIADGVSELAIGIQLKNADLSVVKGYRPSYSVVSGLGVAAGECTESLANGMSYCILKATQPGVKRLRLTNAKVGLEKDITFDPRNSGRDSRGVIAGTQQQGVTSSGYHLRSSAGAVSKQLQSVTSDGYVMYSTVQGALISRD